MFHTQVHVPSVSTTSASALGFDESEIFFFFCTSLGDYQTYNSVTLNTVVVTRNDTHTHIYIHVHKVRKVVRETS